MQTVIDGILINYEVLGNKNTKTILILHGWKNSLKNWESIAKNLANKFKVVLIDLPGFGASSVPKNQPFDTFDYAETVMKFIEKLNLKNITLIGHSFGGKTGIVVASKNNKIDKLILVDASGINSKSLVTLLKIYLSKTVKLIFPKNLAAKVSASLSSEDYKTAGNLKDSFKKIVTQDISENAKKIKIPTLIIWGENDKDVPLTSAKVLKNIIPNSSLRIVWKAGHHPHLEKPEKFLETVEEFLL